MSLTASPEGVNEPGGAEGVNEPEGTAATESGPTALTWRTIVGRHRAMLGVSALTAAISASAGLVPYLVVYRLAVANTEGTLSAEVGALVGLAAVALVVRAVTSGLSAAAGHRGAYDSLADIRLRLIEHLDRIPIGRLRARPAGALKKTLHDDVEQLEEALAHAVPDVVAAATVPVVTTIALFFVDWRLALACLATLVASATVGGWGSSIAKRNEPTMMALSTRLNVAVVAFLDGMRVVRGFAGGSGRTDEVRAAIDEGDRRATEVMLQANVPVSVLMSFAGTTTAAVIPLAAWFYGDGSIALATLVLFVVLSLGYIQPLFRVILTLATLHWRIGLAGAAIDDLLSEVPLAEPVEPQVPQSWGVSFEGVTFAYATGGPPAVAGVDLVIPAGTTAAVVGATGAGKTTLVRLITRSWDVDEGSVRIGGVDVRDIDGTVLAGSVAVVHQDDHVFDDTVAGNIRVARPDASDDEVREAGRRARLDPVVDRLPDGWATPLGSRGHSLSGGERQRISLARAFLRDAPLVILDEATAYLDAESERHVRAAIDELGRDRTLVVVAHRLGSIRHAEQIAVMVDGELSAVGRHEELLGSDQQYTQMWHDHEEARGWHLEAVAADPPSLPAAVASPAPGSQDPDEAAAPGTPVSAGLAAMGAARQWLTLLGNGRVALRRALPWLVAEGMVRGAPVTFAYLAVRDAVDGRLTAGRGLAYGAGVAALIAARVLLTAQVNRRVWRLAGTAKADLQRSITERCRQIPMGRFAELDTGRVTTLVTNDSAMIDFQNMPSMAAAAVVQPVLISLAMALIDPVMALATLVGLPAFWAATLWADRGHRRVQPRLHAARSSTASALLEHVRAAEVLRGHPDAPQAHRYRESVETLRSASIAGDVEVVPPHAIGSVALEVGFLAMIAVGAARFDHGAVSASTLLLFAVLGLVVYQPLSELTALAGYRRVQQEIARRVAEVWDTPVLPEPERPGVPRDASVTFAGVGFDYRSDPDREATETAATLSGVSFTALPGTVTALVGRSGAGKSTVADLISRLWDVDEGLVSIGGIDVRNLTSTQRAALVTTVDQDIHLFGDTVRANLIIGRPDASDAEIAAALDAAQATEVVTGLRDGLDTVLLDGGRDLSGGQRQRLAIARALVKGAPVLVLDEAAASIDPTTEARVQRGLARLAAGRTVIVVAHRLSTIRDAPRIVVLDGGQVEAVGDHAHLLDVSPTYHRLWAASARHTPGDNP